jgi:hypothetical protein
MTQEQNTAQNIVCFVVLIFTFIVVGCLIGNFDASYGWGLFTGIVGLVFGWVIRWGIDMLTDDNRSDIWPTIVSGFILFAVVGGFLIGVGGGSSGRW